MFVNSFLYGFTIDKFRSYLRTYYKKILPSKRNITGSLSEFGKKQAHINKIFSQDLTNIQNSRKKKRQKSHIWGEPYVYLVHLVRSRVFSTLQIDLDQIGKMPRRPESWYNYPQIVSTLTFHKVWFSDSEVSSFFLA